MSKNNVLTSKEAFLLRKFISEISTPALTIDDIIATAQVELMISITRSNVRQACIDVGYKYAGKRRDGCKKDRVVVLARCIQKIAESLEIDMDGDFEYLNDIVMKK